MRSSITVPALCLTLLAVSACSGSAEEKKADAQPVETTTTSDGTATVEEDETAEEMAAPAAPEIDLATVDLESLFTVVGNVDKDQISGVIGQRKPDVFKCYGDELANSPGMAGRVYIQITTTPSGDVASALVKQTTLNNARVESCMTSAMRRWKFPHDPSGGLVVIKYGFQLPP